MPSTSSFASLVAASLALSSYLPGASAAPFASSSALIEPTTNDKIIVWMSKVAPTIFGQDSAGFDYIVSASAQDTTTEAMNAYVTAVASGQQEDMLHTFLNVTMGGFMTSDEAGDMAWKCNSLSHDMAATLEACNGLTNPAPVGDGLVKRSRWRWITSADNVIRNGAYTILFNELGQGLFTVFPNAPRSVCAAANRALGCLSWSEVERFNHYYARQLLDDAIHAADLNKFSVKATGILTNQNVKAKRGAANVCVSNRPDHCS
ncbi:hypothetical protein K461DRAFT_313074 [Myriangium duriaei CBS 260.36]|uniref:WD-like domain-containing protein n=1 Tax=Myriangium duriaei CBS 260.36 TaxID=1168546 RepID=A0A9P4J329_9PEZI|nr:hypothetical protein K461DRAFT_313074 [Myriangium duriaei CBS 260.36]